MKKLLLLFIAAVALCLIAPLTAGAQSDAARIADASRARADSMKLVREQEQAVYAAKNGRTSRILWMIGIVGMCSYAAFWVYRKRGTIMGVIRAFSGGFRTKGDVTTLESKKILIGAIYSDQQDAYLNTLDTGIDSDKRNKILRDWWSITDTHSAEDTLNYLRDKGFDYYFPTVLKAFSATSDEQRNEIIMSEMTTQEDAQKAYSQTHNLIGTVGLLKKEKVIDTVGDIEKYGVRGWDVGRLVFIARLCHDAGYIDEQEAWMYIDAAFAQAQSTFGSWSDLAKSYVIGRCLWGGRNVANEGIASLAENLLENSDSPWNKVAWR